MKTTQVFLQLPIGAKAGYCNALLDLVDVEMYLCILKHLTLFCFVTVKACNANKTYIFNYKNAINIHIIQMSPPVVCAWIKLESPPAVWCRVCSTTCHQSL